MAQPNTVDARLVRVWKGTAHAGGATLLCALVTRGFNQTKQSNTAVIPDCSDPTVVAPVKRTMLSKDAVISGTGYYVPEQRDLLQIDFDDEVSRTYSFEIPATAPNGGYYNGKFFLTTFNQTAEEGNFVQAEMTFEADGPIAWVVYP